MERNTRAALLSLLNETIHVSGRPELLLLALHADAASLCRTLTRGNRSLTLLEGLPVELGLVDAAEMG